MRIILLKDIGGVGQRNTLKDVSDGYALNYLIPNGLAQQATKENLAHHEAMLKHVEAQSAERDAEWKDIIEKLTAEPTVVLVRVNDKGVPYQRVTGGAIEKAIHESRKVMIPKGAVSVRNPITSAGAHIAQIRLGSQRAEIPIRIQAI